LQTHAHKQPPPFANPISRESSPLESACFDFSPLPPPPAAAAAAVEFELDFQASPTEISSLQALEKEEEEEEEERKNERRRSSDLTRLLPLLLYVCALARLHSFASLRLVIRFRFWICATSN
jgi:hypothetical protein